MNTKKTTTTTETKSAPPYANRVTLVGYVGKLIDQNEKRAVFSLATQVSWLPKGSTEWQSQTDWHRIVAWNGLVETASRFKPGDHVIVEGELRSSSYEREVTGQGVTLTTPVVSWEIHSRTLRKLERTAKKKAAKA